MDTATSKALGVDIATAKSPVMDTAMARSGYSDASFLLHRILHQKVRNVENLRGKIYSFVLVPSSYLLGSCKYCRNMKARELKSGYLACGSSMYHFSTARVRVRWNSLNLMELSTKILDEHHRWNAIMWFWGYSPALPSNLGMFDGSLVGMGGQKV